MSTAIEVLGPLTLSGVDVPAARQQRLLLAALVAALPDRVDPDRLMEGLWPDRRPGKPREALQVLVARLRKTLAEAHADIVLGDDGYQLRVGPDAVDLLRFDRLCNEEHHLRSTELADRRRLLEEALDLWRGAPFGDLADEPLLVEVAEGLRLRREVAVGRLHEIRLELGEVDELLPELTSWARSHPLDEAAWSRLAVALHRAGRPNEALRTLHVYRVSVRDAAGVEPTSALVELEARLLADDAAVATNPPTRSGWFRAGRDRSPTGF